VSLGSDGVESPSRRGGGHTAVQDECSARLGPTTAICRRRQTGMTPGEWLLPISGACRAALGRDSGATVAPCDRPRRVMLCTVLSRPGPQSPSRSRSRHRRQPSPPGMRGHSGGGATGATRPITLYWKALQSFLLLGESREVVGPPGSRVPAAKPELRPEPGTQRLGVHLDPDTHGASGPVHFVYICQGLSGNTLQTGQRAWRGATSLCRPRIERQKAGYERTCFVARAGNP